MDEGKQCDLNEANKCTYDRSLHLIGSSDSENLHFDSAAPRAEVPIPACMAKRSPWPSYHPPIGLCARLSALLLTLFIDRDRHSSGFPDFNSLPPRSTSSK